MRLFMKYNNKPNKLIPAEEVEIEIDPSFVEGVKNFAFK